MSASVITRVFPDSSREQLPTMAERPPSLDDYRAILRRRKWQFIVPAALVLVVAAAVAIGLPPVYRSSATILVEEQEIPADLVRSTVTSYAGERIEIISQRVMTAENLGRIIEEYDLYPDLRRDTDLSTAVRRMRGDVGREMINARFADPRSGRSRSATIAFSVSYDSRSPKLAQEVTQAIASLYLEKNLRERQRRAQESTAFLEQEAARLREGVAVLERELASFKERHGDKLPELMRLNLDLMQRTEDRLRATKQEITSLDEQVIFLASELALTEPYSAVYDASGKRVMTPSDRLKALEAEYVGIASRYSAAHPDRKRIEREIAALRKMVGAGADLSDLRRQLQEQQSELQSLRERYSPEHPEVKRLEGAVEASRTRLTEAGGQDLRERVPDADNPAHIQLRARLEAAEAKLTSLQEVKSDLEAKLKEYEARILESPQIEREYKQLVREHDLAVNAYNEINAKLNTARLAESLETESRGERFSLIDPAHLPVSPHQPDRLALAFFGLVLAIGSGVGNLAFREATDQRLYGPRAVEGVTGSPPLAVIPRIETGDDRRRHSQRRATLALSVAVGALLVAVWTHFFVAPLQDLFGGPVGEQPAAAVGDGRLGD